MGRQQSTARLLIPPGPQPVSREPRDKVHGHRGAHILEIGCNTGRNPIHLSQAGYRELAAVEISEAAIRLFRDSYPEVARHSDIHNAPVESVIERFPDNAFDLVFTMAVLEHIHTESEGIFPEVARITEDLLITIEDESGVSERHFPRNYREVFEPLGLRQIERLGCGGRRGVQSRDGREDLPAGKLIPSRFPRAWRRKLPPQGQDWRAQSRPGPDSGPVSLAFSAACRIMRSINRTTRSVAFPSNL